MNETIKKTPPPDAEEGVVKKMREIRDKISLEIMDMSWKERREYFRKGIEDAKRRDRARRQAGQ